MLAGGETCLVDDGRPSSRYMEQVHRCLWTDTWNRCAGDAILNKSLQMAVYKVNVLDQDQ